MISSDLGAGLGAYFQSSQRTVTAPTAMAARIHGFSHHCGSGRSVRSSMMLVWITPEFSVDETKGPDYAMRRLE